MQAKKGAKTERPSFLDVAALLTDLPAHRLARGQVGTIVEELDRKTLLVEFSDDQGRSCSLPAGRPVGLALRPRGRLIMERQRGNGRSCGPQVARRGP